MGEWQRDMDGGGAKGHGWEGLRDMGGEEAPHLKASCHCTVPNSVRPHT